MIYSSASDFRRFLEQPLALPTLPRTVLTLVTKASDRRAGPPTLLDAAGWDPVVVTVLLKILSSPDSGYPQPAKSIREAVDLVDQGLLGNALLSLRLETGNPRRRLLLEDFSRHAMGCAVISELLAARLDYPVPEDAFLAGLMHDLGKIILSIWNPSSFDAVAEQSQSQGLPMLALEESTLGIGHPIAGRLFMEQWNLPRFLAVVCELHHQPFSELPGKDQLTLLPAIVQQADRLCHLWGYGGRGSLDKAELTELRVLTGLSAQDFCTLFIRASDQLRQVQCSLQSGFDVTEEAILDALWQRMAEAYAALSGKNRELQAQTRLSSCETGTKVLIVEDDPVLRRLLIEILMRAGYESDGAEDGLVAIRKLIENRYVATILDLQIPRIDGLEVLLTSRRIAPDMPIVVLTGIVGPRGIDAAKDAGAFRCLRKPASNDEILRAVAQAVASRVHRPEREREASA